MPGPNGPRRLSNAEKRKRGETRPSRTNIGEPQYEQARPDPPDWLDASALEEWARKVEQLHSAGVLTVVDDCALALYCLCWAKVRELIPIVAKEGHSVTAANGGVVRNPNSVALSQAETALNRAMVELGLTPSARTRVKALPKPDVNPWADVDV